MKKITILFILGLCLNGCASIRMVPVNSSIPEAAPSSAQTREESAVPKVRVAILIRQPLVRLEAPESFALSGFPPESTPDSGAAGNQNSRHLREAVLRPDMLYRHEAYIEPLGEGRIQVNGKSYRGSMEILEDAKGTLTVINELPLEDYVMGVLAGEVPRNWPLEALKAQAIAARTFAVYNLREARARGEKYDLENTASFQMYNGTDLINESIEAAVNQTQGEIVTYLSQPVMTFFHSNCGGRTCGALEVWSKDQPYLVSVDCPYGNNGEHFRWKAEISVEDLVRKLRRAGLNLSDIVQMKALDRDESGRVTRLSVMDGDGRLHTLKGSAFRMALGPDLIKSTKFQAKIEGGKVLFSGKGWGHGVGLCQEGACGMALKGFNAFEILRYYYRGITVEKMRSL